MNEIGKVLVTGASGFVGRYLCPALLEAGADKLLACRQHKGTPEWSRGLALGWATLEITNRQAVTSQIRRFRPDLVFHLAAQSHVPTAFKDPAATWTVNTLGTLYLCEALREFCPESSLLYISSGDVYGASFREGKALPEETLPQPGNPYAASKAGAELLVRQYGARGLRTVVLRPFNHIGPGQSERFVSSAFARQIACIEQGKQPPVMAVGNLDTWRDFTDVRDVVAAYVQCGKATRKASLAPGSVFNICSGAPHSIRGVLDGLLKLTATNIKYQSDPKHRRPSDTPYAAGDASRLHEATGWQPQVAWNQTLRDILDDWRGRV